MSADVKAAERIRGLVEADPVVLVEIAGAISTEGRVPPEAITRVAQDHSVRLADADKTRLREATLYLEQPLPRAVALDTDVRALARDMPLIIDESDATIDAFPLARTRGYAGCSSKSCKGIYKSLLNAARCIRWNAGVDAMHAFMTAEDLTAQPGLAVQQDLALAGILGLAHVERNGHHYAAGFAGQHASAREQQAFLDAHPGLYEAAGDRVQLAILDGRIALTSLATRGFASAAWPELESLSPMRVPERARACEQPRNERQESRP